MGRKKKQPEYPKIKIPNDVLITAISKLNIPLDEILKAQNITLVEFYVLLDEYHDALDLKLKQDKQKRKNTIELFQDIKKGLKKLRESMPKLPPRELPPKNYCEVNIGGKWVSPEPKLLGKQSYIVSIN